MHVSQPSTRVTQELWSARSGEEALQLCLSLLQWSGIPNRPQAHVDFGINKIKFLTIAGIQRALGGARCGERRIKSRFVEVHGRRISDLLVGRPQSGERCG